MTELRHVLSATPPGPVLSPCDLERLLSDCCRDFTGDDGGMTGDKLLDRMEEVVWEPSILSFAIERHGGMVLESSMA